jgi:hypothetical protein
MVYLITFKKFRVSVLIGPGQTMGADESLPDAPAGADEHPRVPPSRPPPAGLISTQSTANRAAIEAYTNASRISWESQNLDPMWSYLFELSNQDIQAAVDAIPADELPTVAEAFEAGRKVSPTHGEAMQQLSARRITPEEQKEYDHIVKVELPKVWAEQDKTRQGKKKEHG